MLNPAPNYEALIEGFRWEVPEAFNIARDGIDRVAATTPDAPAIVELDGEARHQRTVTAGALAALSRRLAGGLRALGVGPGERVGVLLGQSVETAAAHLACFRIGAISIPLFTLFGPDALSHRLGHSGARALITTGDMLGRIDRSALPDLAHLVTLDGAEGTLPFAHLAETAEIDREHPTAADDPALLIYTSGTTGPPKGALHAHRVLPGHLPGVEMSHDYLGQPDDRLWTPADWAWIGGLLDVALPALHLGVPVVACRLAKFDARDAVRLMAEHGVRNVFLPPTAIKPIRAAFPEGDTGLALRSVASGGETLGAGLLDWGRRAFGCTINEFYGQTECNMVVSSSAALMAPRPGVMGRPVPGHEVAVIDSDGRPVAEGAEGEIAVRGPDPVMFLGYWRDDAATAAKFRGDWLVTGDRGVMEQGWVRFVGRDDDVIASSGYRIGPGEVEDCLLTHDAVAEAAVVGRPDPARGEIVCAFVVLAAGRQPSDALADEIAAHVKARLAAHEYPREVRFVESLPRTTTGKVKRADLRATFGSGSA